MPLRVLSFRKLIGAVLNASSLLGTPTSTARPQPWEEKNEGSALASSLVYILLNFNNKRLSVMIHLHRGRIRMLRPWLGCCQYIQQPDPHLHWSFQQLPVRQHSHLNLFCSNKDTKIPFIIALELKLNWKV